jgi:hypothetical protein
MKYLAAIIVIVPVFCIVAVCHFTLTLLRQYQRNDRVLKWGWDTIDRLDQWATR